MDEGKDTKIALFELYLATAEKVSDRRAQSNAWILGVNSAIVGLYGYLQQDKPVVDASAKRIWLWVIPAAGIIVCLAWKALLSSYRHLNAAKFRVLGEMEKDLPIQPFTREREIYKVLGRRGLSKIETFIPWCFVLLYAAMIGATLLK